MIYRCFDIKCIYKFVDRVCTVKNQWIKCHRGFDIKDCAIITITFYLGNCEALLFCECVCLCVASRMHVRSAEKRCATESAWSICLWGESCWFRSVFFLFLPFFHFIFFNSACDRVAGVLIHSSRILELGSKGFTSLEHVMRGLCIFVMHCSNWWSSSYSI